MHDHVRAVECISKYLIKIGSGSLFARLLMAHFEQAAILATAWANDPDVKAMALKHAIINISNHKKLKG